MPAIELRYLDAKDIRVFLPDGAIQPHVEIEGDRCICSARIRRIFPLSSEETHISVQQSDGKEYGILRGIDLLDPQSRQVVAEELDRRYFSPVVSRIDYLKQDANMWLFRVQTQRGPAEFYVRHWRDSAFDIGGGRWMIYSVDGLRYEIPKLDELDEGSQKLLDQVF